MSEQPGRLAQWSVLVTRPRHQTPAFCEALHREGARTVVLPTIEIVFPPIATTQLASADHDMLIFTSANAVRGAIQHAPPPWGLNVSLIAAIGPATARALQDAGVHVDVLPSEHNSEGLLQALSNYNLSHSRIAILRGDSGRDLLFEQLQTRAKRVEYVELYQRRLPLVCEQQIEKSVRNTNITTIGSDLGLENLHTLLPAGLKNEVKSRPLIVNSKRSATLAASLGFGGYIGVASPPGDIGQLQA
jgi:uroporphyrinogen-III synthase